MKQRERGPRQGVGTKVGRLAQQWPVATIHASPTASIVVVEVSDSQRCLALLAPFCLGGVDLSPFSCGLSKMQSDCLSHTAFFTANAATDTTHCEKHKKHIQTYAIQTNKITGRLSHRQKKPRNSLTCSVRKVVRVSLPPAVADSTLSAPKASSRANMGLRLCASDSACRTVALLTICRSPL